MPDWLAAMPAPVLTALCREWLLVGARDPQAAPTQVPAGRDWTTWLMLGGRGAGKTRTGAEWIHGVAVGKPWLANAPLGRLALIGETLADVRDVMIEGPSGILAAASEEEERPVFVAARRRVEWPNGAVAFIFSAEDPDSLRGGQFEAAWGDELAKWRHPDRTFDMLQFALRVGERPRQILTTTPRPIPLIKRLLKDPRVALSRMRTADNAAHLAEPFLANIVEAYAGTRLGRQELDGELIEDRPDALWRRERVEAIRVAEAPPLRRLVVALDPPASSGPRADACGIVAAGLDERGFGYVVADATVQGLPPAAWAERAVGLYRSLEADAIVAEVNQGGEMVAAVLRQVDPTVPVVPVRATRGKFLRAEPVAVLYDQGRVRHAGTFPELEDEMCDFVPGDTTRSPDRLDALVWALTHLMLRGEGPRVRVV
ncbi:DNA-packaging protein [Salinarimonas soli]|uniref:DNA-packaging protein n=1 Tax=Salinarimonas soli TaxID=1638099 RepID=A0A5B2VCM2_9HYPH|nr:terminase family protein [Salinarimonas soli]KAA2237233.1 DNA-packaging protein [Salinarimonas soli]